MLEGSMTWIMAGGGALFLLLLLAYLYLKEMETNKRLRHFEKSIEELNKQLYKLQKRSKRMRWRASSLALH